MNLAAESNYQRDLRGVLEKFTPEDGYFPARFESIGHTVLLAAEKFDSDASVIDSLDDLSNDITFHAVKCLVPPVAGGLPNDFSGFEWSLEVVSRHSGDNRPAD